MDLRLTQLFEWKILPKPIDLIANNRVSVQNGKVVIDDTIKTAIDEYYKQYGAK